MSLGFLATHARVSIARAHELLEPEPVRGSDFSTWALVIDG